MDHLSSAFSALADPTRRAILARLQEGGASAGISVDPASLREEYDALVGKILSDATLTTPESRFAHKGGRTGYMHTEHLGHLLATMQWLPRAYPGCQW